MSSGRIWQLFICVALGAALASAVRFDWPSKASAKDTRNDLRDPSDIGVVDINKIFKEYRKFIDQMDKMKTEITAFEEKEVKPKAAALEKLQAEIVEAGKDTARGMILQGELAQKQAETNIWMQERRQHYLVQESRIYHAIYGDILASVKQVSKERRLRLVLRFNSEEITDPGDRAGVLQAVNRPIIFHENLDITPEIIKRLN